MKEQEECVSKEAEESKEELAKALEESQRNAKCVNKYLPCSYMNLCLI